VENSWHRGGDHLPTYRTSRRFQCAAKSRGSCRLDLIFAFLVVTNCVRLVRRAMWRDELQAFMRRRPSSTPLDLFAKLKYEGHLGLWHLLLRVITRFTSDPTSMQVAHLVIALGYPSTLQNNSSYTIEPSIRSNDSRVQSSTMRSMSFIA